MQAVYLGGDPGKYHQGTGKQDREERKPVCYGAGPTGQVGLNPAAKSGRQWRSHLSELSPLRGKEAGVIHPLLCVLGGVLLLGGCTPVLPACSLTSRESP